MNHRLYHFSGIPKLHLVLSVTNEIFRTFYDLNTSLTINHICEQVSFPGKGTSSFKSWIVKILVICISYVLVKFYFDDNITSVNSWQLIKGRRKKLSVPFVIYYRNFMIQLCKSGRRNGSRNTRGKKAQNKSILIKRR